MWYTPNDCLSKQRLFNFQQGARGCGKTTGCLAYCVLRKLKDPSFEAVWMRRYKTEIRKIKSGFYGNLYTVDGHPELKDHEYSIKGDVMFMDKKPLIRFAALSVEGRIRGINSPNVQLIIFDEYQGTAGTRFLPEEVEDYFLTVYDSLARPSDPKRKRVPVLFMSNSISHANPYFLYFGIKLNENGRFMNKSIYAEDLKDAEFQHAAENTEFAQAIRNTEYYRHSVLNETLIDNTTFIEPQSPGCKHIFNIRYKGQKFGFWSDPLIGKAWISKKYDPSCRYEFSLILDDGAPNAYTAKLFKRTDFYKILSAAWETGSLCFDSLVTKTAGYQMLRLLNCH